MKNTKRFEDIYAAAVNFVEGLNLSAKDVFEIMYDSKTYAVCEICAVVDKLFADGFIK